MAYARRVRLFGLIPPIPQPGSIGVVYAPGIPDLVIKNLPAAGIQYHRSECGGVVLRLPSGLSVVLMTTEPLVVLRPCLDVRFAIQDEEKREIRRNAPNRYLVYLHPDVKKCPEVCARVLSAVVISWASELSKNEKE